MNGAAIASAGTYVIAILMLNWFSVRKLDISLFG
jgi:hypothetical protein